MSSGSAGRADSASAPPAGTRQHFSCSLSAVLISRVHDHGGDAAVAQLLRQTGIRRSLDELTDLSQWLSYEEAVALWRAGARITHHPHFARAVGEETARRLNSSPVATVLRSLGSPEAVYRQITVAASKYSSVAELRAVRSGPGFAEIVAVPASGFPRDRDHCEWTCGMLSQPARLFGCEATVEHETCAAHGAPACEYRVTWRAPQPDGAADAPHGIAQARLELDAMRERLHSMFQTASDLIGPGQLEDVLDRIAERAAVEIRAPRHLLAIRTPLHPEPHIHHRGFGDEDVSAYADMLLGEEPLELPESCLVVPVRSNRHDYGRLLAMFERGAFFAEERELLEFYARFAASALDSATALHEAERRYQQSSELLTLARALAAAGTSAEVAAKVADAVPLVVDCDRVGVYLWDERAGELRRAAVKQVAGDEPRQVAGVDSWTPVPGGAFEQLLKDPRPDPLFLDAGTGDPHLRELFTSLGYAATILVPLAAPDALLGLVSVAVLHGPARLRPSADLLDRLSGMAAQATTALQNGRLVDQITHQANHDQLTGLANRVKFTTVLRRVVHEAAGRAEQVSLFYVDLDRFKPVNDEYGHEIGDALLVAVGERLARCTRASDVIARLGGDEFAVLVRSEDETALQRIPERIACAFDEPFELAGIRVTLGASVGRAIFPDDACDPDALLRHADSAMFASKRERQRDGLLRAEIA